MIQPATILIADISGFTNFVTSTELEHSSHIVNELLELIIESDRLGLTVSEIEGDAVLFYKTGDPISCTAMVNQCVATFENFHRRLKLIKRDTVCQCGSCQNVAGLGLKFISHFGMLKEISVANFQMISGLDLIIAHRLLKNEIQSHEYVLVTDSYLGALDESLGCGLIWNPTTLRYTDVGDLGVHYATLGEVRKAIPDPPDRPSPVTPLGDDTLGVEIGAPISEVYSKLIDVDGKRDWVVGLDGVEADDTTARVGQHHVCYFQGMGIKFELVHGEIGPEGAVYSERADVIGMPFNHQQTYTLNAVDDNDTHVRFDVAWGKDPDTPDEVKQIYLGGVAASLESFKQILEDPDDK